MARHTGTRSRPTIVLTTALAVSVPVAFLVVLHAAGIPLLPTSAPPAAAVAAPVTKAPIASLVDSPAVNAVTAVLTAGPGGGWSAAGPLTWAVGTPYDYACRLSSWTGPGSTVSAQRTYSLAETTTAPVSPTPAPSASGAPSSTPATQSPPAAARSVTVTLHAFGAGAGAAAFTELRARIDSCPQREASVDSSTMDIAGTTGLAGLVRPEGSPASVSTVTWRRGDLLFDVHSVDLSQSELVDLATSIDRVGVADLTPVCPQLDSTQADGARSPWVNRDSYTGLLADQPVVVPEVPLPAAPAGVTPRNLAAPLDPLPAVVLPSVQPSDPVWPAALPAPVPAPSSPTPVPPQPTAAIAKYQVRDDVGPGCGWAFTGQSAPPFNQDAADAARAASINTVRSNVLAAQQAWGQQVVAYWTAAAAYEQAIGRYRLYAAQVQQVSTAWAAIQSARDAYVVALATWQQAVNQRTALIGQQQAAALAYQNALAVCAAQPSNLPTISSSPTATTTEGPTGQPSPTTTAGPSPSSPSTTPTPACPPTRPAVLDQVVPPVPPAPVPPPDPRPTPAATPTTPASPSP